MRVKNRIFADSDSDPKQDPYGLISKGAERDSLPLMDRIGRGTVERMYTAELYAWVRLAVLVEGKSQRAVAASLDWRGRQYRGENPCH
jgi:hypothetical protein